MPRKHRRQYKIIRIFTINKTFELFPLDNQPDDITTPPHIPQVSPTLQIVQPAPLALKTNPFIQPAPQDQNQQITQIGSSYPMIETDTRSLFMDQQYGQGDISFDQDQENNVFLNPDEFAF